MPVIRHNFYRDLDFRFVTQAGMLPYVLRACLCITLTLYGCAGLAQQKGQAQQLVSSSKADTWVATDGLGRSITVEGQGGKIREDKFVGVFYFTWMGAHGYDTHRGSAPDEGIMTKVPADTVSPYDITKLLAINPENPEYGPINAFHHWGEPHFGYYLSNDEWVIRKHAQMLSDAGVDVILLDVTNGLLYLPIVSKIGDTYRAMRKEGLTTPSISFVINSAPERTVQRLYDNFYKKGLYEDLWFYWKGKPLVLCPPQALTEETRNFFTTRQSWAWTEGQEWFGDGKDKWPWLDHYPQNYGWHESKDKPEQVTVSIAQHPMSNIGRSYHNGQQPSEPASDKGLYFEEQWKRAHEVDPEFVFITGWNEWVAMRFNNGRSKSMLGKEIKKGDTYFVDLYNAEFSRDAEPVKGDFKDNYYYQMVHHIRKFKGSRPLPVALKSHAIKVDGKFSDWEKVEPVFHDDSGDTFHRNHPGWGRIKSYVNTTGRNDIIECKVASDKNNVAFYVKTKAPLTSHEAENWMNLYISVKDSKAPAWEGYHFVVNRKVKDRSSTMLERSTGGWNWEEVAQVKYKASGNELEVIIPKKALSIGEPNFTLDFKWVDNAPADGDIMHWLDKGDAAPNARFNYRYSRK